MKKLIITILLSTLTFTSARFINRSEITLGRVINSNGDGKEYNGDSFYNYIHYHTGNENDIVMTYFLLNPFNDYCDDIIYRKDFIVLHDTPSDNLGIH